MSNRNPEPRALLAAADQLLGRGSLGEAIRRYREALSAYPQMADGWFNLGYALRQQGEYPQALEAYAEALRRGARDAEQIHLNRAVILADCLRDDAAAERELRQALTISPSFEPAWLNLGNLYEERGLRSQALQCYERILSGATESRHALEALARVAHLRPRDGPGDPILLSLRQAAETRKDIDDSLRANLYFALGQALDLLGEYASAFSAYSAAKFWAHRPHPYQPIRAERETQALIDCFHAPTAAVAADQGGGAEPLFICGMFRSGSTLLEQVLAGHPAVVAGGELDLLPRIVAHQLSPFPAAMSALDESGRRGLATEYLNGLRQRVQLEPGLVRYATDKRPDNYRLIGLIKHLFPRARILHTVRNPLDNALSVFTQHLNPRQFPYAGSLAGIGHHYGQYRRLMAHWQSLYPNDIHDFDYDAFVAQPEATLKSLLDFLGLPWREDCLRFHSRENTVKTASYWQVRQPLHANSSGRWRNYRGELAPLFEALRLAGV